MRKVCVCGLVYSVVLLLCACHKQEEAALGPVQPRAPAAIPQSSHYFKTDFQDETQFIVESITTDLAEQMFYAKNRQLPDAKDFSVQVTEKPDSKFLQPTYDVQVNLGSGHPAVAAEIPITGPIWSPDVYAGFTSALAEEIGLAPQTSGTNAGDASLLEHLTDSTADTIEFENQKLSSALQADFTDPVLHEKAAMLIGAFALREHDGSFFDIRLPLSRITAHLAMARYLAGINPAGINGQVAGAVLLTLMNDQAAALKALEAIPTASPAVTGWIETLRTYATNDYRPIAALTDAYPIERVAWLRACGESANINVAWNKLSATEKMTTDFERVANTASYSVDTGHDLLQVTLSAEFKEIGAVYQSTHGEAINSREAVAALNQMPERCFSMGGDGKSMVRVIGWGQWAMFFQRQLGSAVSANYDFLENRWGVTEDAAKFSVNMDAYFKGMRLYPFVRRFDCATVADFHSAVDDGLKVTVETPQLVPAECWNYLCYRTNFAPEYRPNPNPHINEWHKHNPPPGTVYNIWPRLNHPSLIGRPDTKDHIAKLHQMAPYDTDVDWYIYRWIYHRTMTYQQAEDLYAPVLAYDCNAIHNVAALVSDNPPQYEALMTQAAAISPDYLLGLGDYLRSHDQGLLAANTFEKAERQADAVGWSNRADWIVCYYLKMGLPNRAKAAADEAAEIYSSTGLRAKAEYLEAVGDPAGAYDWYEKMVERYNQSGPLIAFCIRYKNRTGDTRYDAEEKKLQAELFPNGFENDAITTGQPRPVDGVAITTANHLMQTSGLRAGDVIVGVSGVKVHNVQQYYCARELSTDDTLHLAVWHGSYKEIVANVPCHSFGADTQLGNYRPY